MADRFVIKPSIRFGDVKPSLYFIRDTHVQTTHEPETYEWFKDVLVRDKNNRMRSFSTAKAAQKAVDKLNEDDDKTQTLSSEALNNEFWIQAWEQQNEGEE